VALRKDFAVMKLERLSELSDATEGHQEYLLFINSEEQALLAYPSNPASQYFRRLLARSAGRELWNWNDEIILGVASQRKEWILNLHRSWNNSHTG
jgi:hypothetical protein